MLDHLQQCIVIIQDGIIVYRMVHGITIWNLLHKFPVMSYDFNPEVGLSYKAKVQCILHSVSTTYTLYI